MGKVIRGMGWCAAAVAMALAAGHAARSQSLASYQVTLKNPRVSAPADGRVVVSMEATGDLHGMVTFTLDRDGSGEWAFEVAHATYLNPGAAAAGSGDGSAADAEGEHHGEWVHFVNRGSLGGRVHGATLQYGASGALSALDGLQLTIVSGSLEFEGVRGGGSAAARSLGDMSAATGTLMLNF